MSRMKINVLLPGTTESWHCGGLFIAIKLAGLFAKFCPAEIVTYKEHEPDHPFLTEELLEASPPSSTLWIITWGPHIAELLGRLAGRRVAYYAQSAGWSIDVPSGVAILCISRFVMAYWAQWAPHAPLFLLPPTLDPKCRNERQRRDIDLLYLSRKTTPYLQDELIPHLRQHCRVETIDGLIPHHKVLDLFNRSKLYVYDYKPTAERAWVDGFGLQPLEAIVCGCTVFTTLSGGPCDYLDPGVNCAQISGDRERDASAVLTAVARHAGSNPDEKFLREAYSEEALLRRLGVLVKELEALDLRAAAGFSPPAMAAEHEMVSRQQQEISVLKMQVRHHEKSEPMFRESIEWLKAEVAQRDRMIAARQEGIDWLKDEIAQREQSIRGRAPRSTGIGYRIYRRALGRYNRMSSGMVRSLFEKLIQFAVIILSRWKGVRFPSRQVGGWWWVWRWRFEFLLRWNEVQSVAACRRFIREGMTVVDVGAHIGYYTRLFSELVGPSGRVLAFEPEPENFALLRQNLRGAKYKNVEMFNCALADRGGTMSLHLSSGHSNHSLIKGYTESAGSTKVDVVTMDAFLDQHGIDRVDFVKIDVEGAEPLVLAGMQKTLARCPDLAMLVEFNRTALQSGGASPEAFARSLSESSFSLQATLPDGRWGDIPSEMSDEVVNLLCLRNSARVG